MNLEKSLELASDGQLRTLLRHVIPYRPVMFIYGDYCRFKKRHFSIVQLEMRLRWHVLVAECRLKKLITEKKISLCRVEGDRHDAPIAKYSPVPNIRPGPNYRPDGDQWSKLIRDQDLFTDHMGLYQNFQLATMTFNYRPLGIPLQILIKDHQIVQDIHKW